ncbi:EF-hand domain-containing protein [Sphingomonas sp.]|uniref:EF-hand domain-containing protein n=1 Tax=Sphingomonas sp. TaxID=28214 RepID=UPI00286C571E|nr:EF-hand domain-containing protein [Sphingomonas sp.]
MKRIMVGVAAILLATTGGVLFWQGHAESRASLPDAPAALGPTSARLFAATALPELPGAPEASQKTREQKRFHRVDKDDDGKITAAELLAPRQKAFAKLDADHNGALSFNEWAAKTIGKFQGADDDRSGWLTATEYAETAPKRKAHTRCSC